MMKESEIFEEDYKYFKARSSNITELIKYVNQNDVKNIGINRAWGYDSKKIDFLTECPSVERLFIVDNDIDLTPITSLVNSLRSLVTNSVPHEPIDLTMFDGLEELRIDGSPNWRNLDKVSGLKKLRLDKAALTELTSLSGLKNLESLHLVGGKWESLKGLNCFDNLHSFTASGLPKLKNLGISEPQKTIMNFELENCKKVSDLTQLRMLVGLERLVLNNCGEIESIGFVKDLLELKDFRFPFTNVTDGNLSVLETVQHVYFTNKRHYSNTYEELRRGRLIN